MPGNYGPKRTGDVTLPYTSFPTKPYVLGHANKIAHDLEKIARLYSGHKIRIFDAGSGERCQKCTDDITGEIVIANCPVCKGTGVSPRRYVGSYWSFIDFNPEYKIATEFGNTENPGSNRETFVVINAPLLHDQWLIVTDATKKVHKIIDVMPQIVALQGRVITQIAVCSKISFGEPEYSVVNW